MGISCLETSYEVTISTELHFNVRLWVSSWDTPHFYHSVLLRTFFMILCKGLSVRNHWGFLFSHFRFQQQLCWSYQLFSYPMNVVSCGIAHISPLVFTAIKLGPGKSMIHILQEKPQDQGQGEASEGPGAQDPRKYSGCLTCLFLTLALQSLTA